MHFSSLASHSAIYGKGFPYKTAHLNTVNMLQWISSCCFHEFSGALCSSHSINVGPFTWCIKAHVDCQSHDSFKITISCFKIQIFCVSYAFLRLYIYIYIYIYIYKRRERERERERGGGSSSSSKFSHGWYDTRIHVAIAVAAKPTGTSLSDFSRKSIHGTTHSNLVPTITQLSAIPFGFGFWKWTLFLAMALQTSLTRSPHSIRHTMSSLSIILNYFTSSAF